MTVKHLKSILCTYEDNTKIVIYNELTNKFVPLQDQHINICKVYPDDKINNESYITSNYALCMYPENFDASNIKKFLVIK